MYNEKLNPTKIHLLSSRGDMRIQEGNATETLTPGMLLRTTDAGTPDNPSHAKHNVSGGAHSRLFLMEDALQGKGIDEDYASGDRTRCVIAEPGDIVYAWLKNGEHATPDEFLASNGDGTLKVATGTNVIVARAKEEVDLSDTAVENGRIRVEVI